MSDDTASPSESPAPRNRRRQGALLGVLLLLGSSWVDMLLGAFEFIYVTRLIGVVGRGLMVLVDLFNKYLSGAYLAPLQGLSKQLPMALGRKDEPRAQELEDVGITSIILLGLAGSLSMLFYALFGGSYGRETREVLAVGAGIVMCGANFNVYRIVLRSWGTYSVLALASVITTLAEFGLEIAGAHFFGVLGAAGGWLGANLAQLLYLHFCSDLRIRLRWDWRLLWYLARSGWRLALVVYSDVLLITVDLLVVTHFLRVYNLGLYGVASSIAGYVKKIPDSAGFVLMPRIWEKYGAENGDALRLRDQVVTPTLAAATVMPVVSGLLFIMIPSVLALLLPAFAPAAYAAQILCMGGAFLALPLAANGLLIAMNREVQVGLTKVAGAAIIGAGAYWTLTHGGKLGEVAMFAVTGYAFSSALALIAALRLFYPRFGPLLRELALCHLPFLWAMGAIKGAGVLARVALGADVHSGPGVLLRMLLFLVLCLPPLWYGNQRTGVLSRLRLLLKEQLGNRRS
jgi:O-antigen/teichoic acid export membrane protein